MKQKIWNSEFILLISANLLISITYYSLISTLPVYISEELHASKSIVGIVLASYIVASVLVRPFSGYALDHIGRKSIYLSALLLYALIFCGYAFALTILFLIILRFAHGFTWGITTIAGSTNVIDIIPLAKRGEGIGFYALSTTMGMAVGPVFGLFFLHHWGYFTMFFAGFFISLVGFICASCVKYPPYKPVVEDKNFSWSMLFEVQSILPSLNLTIIQITYGGLLSFIALFGHEIGIRNASGFFLIYALGIAISRILSGKEFDKRGPKYIMPLCISLLIIGFIVLSLIKNPFGFYGSAIILGFGNGVIFPTFQTMVNNLSIPTRRGAANSTLYTALDLGMGLGMIVMGFISQSTSITTAFLVSSCICGIGLIYFMLFSLGHYEKNKLI
ncbi:MAG: MFS transporter [Bacteroidota bacterium]|nr:MFS transporter [Bacteroidota bacterium]